MRPKRVLKGAAEPAAIAIAGTGTIQEATNGVIRGLVPAVEKFPKMAVCR